MGSVSELQGIDLCDSCLQPAETLFNHDGERLCERCRAVFWTATVLFDNEITYEAEIVPTIAFAARMGELGNLDNAERCRQFVQEFAQKYRRFELTGVADGVPVLRLRPVVIDVVRYVGSTLPRKIQIEILSRFAEADKVAELYEQTLVEENIHFDACTGGNIIWNAEEAHLSILVEAKSELHPSKVGDYSEYPKGRIYSFPPPNLIREFYVLLLGSTDKRTFAGYAYGLGDPEREMQIWTKRLADAGRQHARAQDGYLAGAFEIDELRAKLDALETERKIAARELEAVRSKAERLASLRLETEALIEAYTKQARAGLDLYTPQDKFDAYKALKALGLKMVAHPDGTIMLSGVSLCSNEKT
jgi:hypothetical protein